VNGESAGRPIETCSLKLIAGAHERQGGANHIGALRTHASAVVHHQADGDRDIFVAKRLNLLKDLIFVNLEIFLAESGDRSAFTVPHCCPQDNQVHIHSDRERTNLVGLWGVLRDRNAG
jgi:hypothetical protein